MHVKNLLVLCFMLLLLSGCAKEKLDVDFEIESDDFTETKK
jgi:hypothetical protein